MAKRPDILFDPELLLKADEIKSGLESVASAMGADLDLLSMEKQFDLMRRALELRIHIQKRAERFVAYWVPDDE